MTPIDLALFPAFGEPFMEETQWYQIMTFEWQKQ